MCVQAKRMLWPLSIHQKHSIARLPTEMRRTPNNYKNYWKNQNLLRVQTLDRKSAKRVRCNGKQ